jgi:spermidine/putrescine transport system substrate-binding protein
LQMSSTSFSRRSLVKAASFAGVAGLATPALVRRALASSGELKVFAWSGYISDAMLADFEKKTGIKVTYTPYGTNDELLNQLKATQGKGYDLIMPTVDRVPNYVEAGLVQALDESKVKWDGCIASAVKGSASMGAVVADKRYMAPSDWGTEALAFETNAAQLSYGTASYLDMWKADYTGKVTLRGHSGLVGIGIGLEAEGKLPHPMRDSFTDEKIMRANYEEIIKFAIANKKSVVQFWTNENEAQGAFRTNGAVIGQTWDSSAAALRKEGLPVRFVAPREGALAWMEGFAIPSGAENVEQAYEFINWYYTPEVGVMYSNHTGINTTAKGAEALLAEANKQFFADAYPQDALDKLWWWPIQQSWFVAARNEYQERFISA